MASGWRRLKARQDWKSHSVKIALRQESGGSDRGHRWVDVPWAETDYLSATVRAIAEGQRDSVWAWELRGWDKLIANGQANTEAGARAAVTRRVKPLIAERITKYRPAAEAQLREGESIR
jgi:hypothetical protein